MLGAVPAVNEVSPMRIWLIYAAVILSSYLWGSVCWGVVLSLSLKHEDIRLKDNPGLSGTVRQYGWPLGLTVGALDILKGYLVGVVLRRMALPSWVVILAFAAVIIGHNWPAFFQFRGGGGLATTVGILLEQYPLSIAWGLPFAAAAGILWKLVPALKAKVHFSPFIAAVGAVPAVIWIVVNTTWYPNYILVLGLALAVLLKGNQFHRQAQRLRRLTAQVRERYVQFRSRRTGDPR
jgi:glycerol-3-phosphate acyltransferase PlsY